jgi:nucleoid-associated protein YgaU
VVKDGDNLWKIAADQLGNGSRYKEIIKLNPGIVSHEDNLDVGTRLRLPVR